MITSQNINTKIFSGSGYDDVRDMIANIVKDLTGVNIAEGDNAPPANPNMIVIKSVPTVLPDFPRTADVMVTLESTQEIDPFAVPVAGDGGVPNMYDPWRLTLHSAQWSGRKSTSITGTAGTPADGTSEPQWAKCEYTPLVLDVIKVNSMAVYVGTSATQKIGQSNSKVSLGWVTTSVQRDPGNKIINYVGPISTASAVHLAITPNLITVDSGTDKLLYKKSYKGRDLVEPIGNTGAQWTNSFDPVGPANLNSGPATYSGSLPVGLTASYQNYDAIKTGVKQPTGDTVSPTDGDGPEVTDPSQLFVNRYVTFAANVSSGNIAGFGGMEAEPQAAETLSYRLVLTDHGLFLGVWGPDPEERGTGFSWLLVQRPVDKKTGVVRGVDKATGTPFDGTNAFTYVDPITSLSVIQPIGNRPLFCVNSVNGKFWKFVVREHDQVVPSTRKDATINGEDSGAVLNPYQQQSLTENGEYVITFLNNLNSSRFKYSDELDMLGTVSSDVVGGGSDVTVSVYSEEQKRSYHALWSSGSFGTKMRVMVVGAIPSPNTGVS